MRFWSSHIIYVIAGVIYVPTVIFAVLHGVFEWAVSSLLHIADKLWEKN